MYISWTTTPPIVMVMESRSENVRNTILQMTRLVTNFMTKFTRLMANFMTNLAAEVCMLEGPERC
jgi:methyltransferase-like protein